MRAIILAAGYGTRLGDLGKRTPKALLTVGGRPIVEYLLRQLAECGITRGVLVSNARFFRAFSQYFAQGPTPVTVELLNDGSTEPGNRLGAVRDMALALRLVDEKEPVFVTASDNVYTASLRGLVSRYEEVKAPVVAVMYEEDLAVLRRSGVATVDAGGRITGFVEKPAEPSSPYASPPLYVYPPDIRYDIEAFLNDPQYDQDAPGNLVSFLVKRRAVHAFVLPGKRYDIGSLSSYQEAQRAFGERM